MSARPLVTVQKTNRSIPLPKVFSSPLRYDIVQFVHTCLRKNQRQPYAVSRRTGHKNSAESWGTGRAVARIPRVSGGGTSRSGQGAFGNMCRGGRMFAPTKVFRKWTAKVTKKVRRYAVRAALAATAIPSLVLARGHCINRIPEIPLVVPNSVEALKKTRDAVKLLKDIGAYDDVKKATESRHIRCGVGKRENRRYVTRKGPLLVVSKRCEARRAFRKLGGMDINYVSALNLLRLAPGGHFGRLVIWTEDAFKRLDDVLHVKKIQHLPDSKRVINSAEVQGVIRPKKFRHPHQRGNRQRPVLNPALKLEKAMNRTGFYRKMRDNRDPRMWFFRKRVELRKWRIWRGRVLGKLNKKGGPKGTKEAMPRIRKPRVPRPEPVWRKWLSKKIKLDQGKSTKAIAAAQRRHRKLPGFAPKAKFAPPSRPISKAKYLKIKGDKKATHGAKKAAKENE